MRRAANLILVSLLLLAALPVAVTAQTVHLYDGDTRYFDDPPDLIAYANVNHVSPPSGVTITDSGGLWRYYGWIALMQQGQWIEATYNGPDTTSVGVQLWGDFNDGWARVLVDGAEVWTGDTYAPTAVGFIKYLEISGLTAGPHTIRVENMGIQGTGSAGDDVAVYFFGFESATSPTPPPTGVFTFYAVYDRLVDTDSHDVRISLAAMSGDGNRLIFAGTDNTTGDPILYTVNADGTGLTQIAPLDLGGRGITEVAIDQDGSRAFFLAYAPGTTAQLYKVEGGAITLLLDTAASPSPELIDIRQIQCTADGEYVYFLDVSGGDGDVWRMTHGGGGVVKVIEDRDVSATTAYGVHEFAISADGSVIAFLLDPLGEYYAIDELFIRDAGGYHQLTSDRVDKVRLAISGDGTTIVFDSDWKWNSIRSDGSGRMALETSGFNFGGNDLTYDGTQMFYDDDPANGGRLTNTDGSGRLDLFPQWNVATITLAVTWEASISDDGRRVAFVFQYSTWPFKEALYVGHLNNPDAVPDAPTIHNIAFDPAVMPNDDPNARMVLTSQISDPQGLADIERTSTDQLLDGYLESGTANLPAYFYIAAHDDGSSPDQTADDGAFSTEGQPGGKIAELDQMTVRMGARDSTNTVVVADTTLLMGSVGQMPILPPTNVQAQPGVESIALTWNPSTSADLAGYNVYHSTVYTDTSASGAWTKINTALVTGDRYLDTSSLTTGITHFYYLTSVDSASSESDPSNIASAQFGQIKLFIPDSYGTTAVTVTLPVNIANADGLDMYAVDIYVTYDQNVLTATDVERTALTAGYGWAKNIATPGIVRAVIATATEGDALYGEGALFNVLFDVVGSSGDTTDLEFQVTGTFFYECDDLYNAVPLDLSDVGVFTVQGSYVLGDINGDGVVNSADAALALQIAVGNVIPTSEQEAAGDVNGDVRINSADAALIMRLAAGLPLVATVAQMRALTAVQAAAVSISAPIDAAAPQGGSAWVPLSVDDAASLASADITLNYDPFIATATGVRTTSLSTNFDVEFNVPVAGQARVSLKPKPGYEGGLTSGSGALVEVQFTGSLSATAGMTSTLNLAAVRLADQYGRDFATSALQVDVNTANGVLTVEEAGYFIYLPLIMRAYP